MLNTYLPNCGSVGIQCKNMAIYQATYYCMNREKYTSIRKNEQCMHTQNSKGRGNDTYQFHFG